MKKFKVLMITYFCFWSWTTILNAQVVDNSDIKRFWTAYDLIKTSKDTSEHLKILQREFITPGTKGLKAIMEKKGYTIESYLAAIHKYPKFWNSVRNNTLKTGLYAKDIEKNIKRLKKLYPDLKPAQIYFTIGVLRSGGTAHEGHVLIGSELAMADSTVITNEIEPIRLRENLHNHFCTNPIDDVVLLNVHEYVHTQQGDYGNDLLSMCIFEGVAEFVSTTAAQKQSGVKAIPFGKANDQIIKERFQKEMFSPNWNDWLYNDRSNEFKIRDLGYYVGYAICEGYYNNSADKSKAIKEMIELDCTDKKSVLEFLEKSEYLSEDYEVLTTNYNNNKPEVVSIKEYHCNHDLVDPNLTTITIQFSKEMNPRFRNFKLGPKGAEHVLPVTSFDWNENNTAVTLGVELTPDFHYQLLVSEEFRDLEGRAVEHYLIDFKTAAK